MRTIAVIAAFALSIGVAVSANEKPTPEFQQAMKDNGATMQKLAKDADAKDYTALAADAAALKAAFMGPIGKFFTEKKMDAALTKCKEAYAASDSLEKAAKEKNDTAIADARKAVQGSCGGCHTAHRERLADGTFEVK